MIAAVVNAVVVAVGCLIGMLLGGRLQEAKPYELPDGSGQRALVCIKKISQTSTKYPRNAAKMAKSPLV